MIKLRVEEEEGGYYRVKVEGGKGSGPLYFIVRVVFFR